MTQSRRRALRKGLLVALLLFVGAIAALRTQWAADSACTALRRELPALTGMDVGITRCELEPVSQTVRLQGLSFFEPGADTPLLAADFAEVSAGRLDPLFGPIELDDVRIIRPRVSLDLTKPSSGKKGGACSLDFFRKVAIDRLDVRGAEVTLTLPQDRVLELTGGDVTWRRRRGRAEIQVQARGGRVLTTRGAELEVGAITGDVRFDSDRERLEVVRAEAALDAVSVSLSGEVQNLCDPELQLEASVFVPMTTVAKVAGFHEPVAGHVWTRLSIEGKAQRPSVTAELAANDLQYGHYRPGGFDARATLVGDEVRIDEFEASAGQGVVRAKGTLALARGLPVSLDVDLERAEFGPVMAKAGIPGAWVDFPASGRAKVAGTLWPLRVEGGADLDIGRFKLASRAYDAPATLGRMILEFERAHATTTVQVLPDRVELHGITVASDKTEVKGDATLHYAKEKGLEVRGALVQADFSDFGHLSGIHWAGKGSGTFVVKGPYHDISASAEVSLRDFDYWKMSLGVVEGRIEWRGDTLAFPAMTGQKGKTQYHGSGKLLFPKDGPFWSRGEVTVNKGGRLEDLVDVLLPMHENMDHFVGILDGEVDGTVTVDCPSDAFAGKVDFDVRKMRYFDRRFGDGHMVLRFVDGTDAVLEPFVLKGPLGTTRVAGTWNFDGPLDYDFRIDGDLAEVVGPERAKKLELEGDLALVGKVGGDTTVWTVAMWLTSPSVHLAGKDLGATHLEGRMAGRDLQVWGRPFGGTTANLKLRVKTPYPWELSANVALPEIRSLLPEAAVAQGVSGALSGSLSGKGNLKDLQAMEGQARVDKLQLVRGDFSGQNDGAVDLSFRGGRLAVDHFRFRGPNTELSLGGAAGPKDLDIDLHGSLDMRLLESFVPQLERSSGRIELTAAARGTLEAPTVTGTASVSDARLSLRDLPVTLRGLSGRVEFSEARVLVQDVRGVLNDGRVELEGDVRLQRFTPKNLELRAQVDGVSMRLVEYLPFTATGELILYGKPDLLTLAGNLDIDKLRYDQPLQLESFLTDLRTAKVGGGATGEPRKEWLAFDVNVAANGDVRVENNLANARLHGALRLTGTNVHPGLLGTIEAAEGSQIYFRGNTFSVSQALVEFKERKEIDPIFDLHAQTRVREYAINLHGFGRMKDPQVILSADPDLAEADILSLLTLGVTSRDKSDALGTGGFVVTEALFNASGLDRQVQRFLPKNPLLRDLSFHISSGYNEASGAVEPMAHFESKFLTERLELDMTQPMVSAKGTRARAEYRFDDRLSGQFQWDNERSENLPNFGVDLKLRWEVE